MRVRMILTVIFLAAGMLAAQTFRGGIQGTVTDSSGAAVAGAQVTVTSAETGLTRTVGTDAAGNYTATELPLGTYNLTATKNGFRTAVVKGVTVGVSTTQRADIRLTPGEVKQTVEVTAEQPLVETTGNTIGGTIEASRAEELPVNGRDFLKLLTLVPGAAADASSVSDAAGSFGIFSINGNRGRANNYLLDGTDMNDGYRNDPAINEAGVFGAPPCQSQGDEFLERGGSINPVIQKLLNRNPWAVPGGLPAGDPSNLGSATVQVSDPFTNRVDSFIAKIDQHFGTSERDLFTG